MRLLRDERHHNHWHRPTNSFFDTKCKCVAMLKIVATVYCRLEPLVKYFKKSTIFEVLSEILSFFT